MSYSHADQAFAAWLHGRLELPFLTLADGGVYAQLYREYES